MAVMSSYDLVVFDMEDALIDRSSSEVAAVGKAIDAYLTVLIGVRPEGGPVFSHDEVKTFVETQGFEADVDVLHALLCLALHTLSVEVSESEFGVWDGRDMLEAVKASGQVTDSLGDLARRKNVPEFVKLLRQKGGGKRGFARVRGLRNKWLALAEGHIMMDNYVRRVLAEAYLSEELFQKEYSQSRQFIHDDGTIGLERSWIAPAHVAQIRQRCPLAAVTDRSQIEAQYVLDRTEIGPYIEVVVSQGAMGLGLADETETNWIQSLGVGAGTTADYATKVTEAIERLRAQEGLDTVVRVAWVGNTAAENRGLAGLKERYRLTVIGCAFGTDKKIMTLQREKGADITVSDGEQLLRAVSERPRVHGPERGRGHGY